MGQKEFGQVVALLRREQFDPLTGISWNREKLGEQANFSKKTIADIEQGRRLVKPAEVTQLAPALHLGHSGRRYLVNILYHDSVSLQSEAIE